MKSLVDKVWPLTVAVTAFLVANLDAIVALVQGELERAGGEFSWESSLLILAGLVTMFNVWSKASARALAAGPPQEL